MDDVNWLVAKKLLREFFELMDKKEETDSGIAFHPNFISSCRVVDCEKIQDILVKLKKLSGEGAQLE